MPSNDPASEARGGLIVRFGDNAVALLVITMLCWAGNFVVGRWSTGEIGPVALAWLRWTLAGLLLAGFAWRHAVRDWPMIQSGWRVLLLLAVTGAGMFNTLQYLALNHTLALNALVINSSGPVFVALACLVLFRDRVGPAQWVGIGLSLSGVLTVVSKGSLAAIAQISVGLGDLLMLLAMLIWGVYTACLRRRPQIHFLSFALVQMVVASIVNLPFFIWEASSLGLPAWSPKTLVSVVYVAIFPSIIAYICYQRGVQLIGGARAGAFLYLTTLFGAVLSFLLLGERPEAYHFAGFALIIVGVAMAARRGAQR